MSDVLNGMKLSVIMPVYNERDTLEEIVRQVKATGLVHEIIMVDDGSTDGTREIMKQWHDDDIVRVFYHEKNSGKGSAVRTGFKNATGDIYIIQDADLEYDPRDYIDVIRPIVEGRADVAYGSRFLGKPARKMNFWHRVGNFILTMMTNVLYNLDLTDMETCYKAFRREIIQSIRIEEDRFGFEPEITAKIAKLGCRVYEVGISYSGRTYEQGKKIGWKDGVRAVYCILRYNLRRGGAGIQPFAATSTSALDTPVDAEPGSIPPRSAIITARPSQDAQARVGTDDA